MVDDADFVEFQKQVLAFVEVTRKDSDAQWRSILWVQKSLVITLAVLAGVLISDIIIKWVIK